MKRLLLLLLIFVPIALVADLSEGNPVLVFILAALAVIPLADLIGEATEELATYTGPKVGGLLNATLGNAAELIITILAIKEGLLELVLASITGSILGNLLLIMGLSTLLGGLKHGVQTFDRRQAALNATLLVLAVMALLIPSVFSKAIEEAARPNFADAEKTLSELVAVVMIVLYGLSIYYSFRGQQSALHPEPIAAHKARWSMRFSIVVLVGATLATVIMSEVLVGAVEAVTASLGLSEIFLGIIIVPLIGNVAEHLVAVEMAYKNKMELSLAVSLGSSLQIALFVAPVLVFISLLFPGEPLLLIFSTLELIALAAASIIAAFIAQDGESNWFEGAMLLAVFLIIAIAFYFIPTA